MYGTEKSDKYSWLENYAGSSGFKDSVPTDLGMKIDQLEIDQAEYAVTFCPLLKDPASYNPDTTDLAQDKEARCEIFCLIIFKNYANVNNNIFMLIEIIG